MWQKSIRRNRVKSPGRLPLQSQPHSSTHRRHETVPICNVSLFCSSRPLEVSRRRFHSNPVAKKVTARTLETRDSSHRNKLLEVTGNY